ncbi:MAG: transposase [Candidatus Binataceae bacterium]
MTICVFKRDCILGGVVDDEMRLNELGRSVADCLNWLTRQYAYVDLDECVVMPNHVHAILVLTGGSRSASGKTKTLSSLVGAFKSRSTSCINGIRGTRGAKLWQRGFYEHVIRDETDFERIRRYIRDNPAAWASDEENPATTRSGN